MATKDADCSHVLCRPLPQHINPSLVVTEFLKTINMKPDEIEAFLLTTQSREAVEQGVDESEKEGRHLARRVIELLNKCHEHQRDPHAYPLSLLYDADIEQMYQITEYIKCKKQDADLCSDANALQRYELMNVGYDPMKK